MSPILMVTCNVARCCNPPCKGSVFVRGQAMFPLLVPEPCLPGLIAARTHSLPPSLSVCLSVCATPSLWALTEGSASRPSSTPFPTPRLGTQYQDLCSILLPSRRILVWLRLGVGAHVSSAVRAATLMATWPHRFWLQFALKPGHVQTEDGSAMIYRMNLNILPALHQGLQGGVITYRISINPGSSLLQK